MGIELEYLINNASKDLDAMKTKKEFYDQFIIFTEAKLYLLNLFNDVRWDNKRLYDSMIESGLKDLDGDYTKIYPDLDIAYFKEKDDLLEAVKQGVKHFKIMDKSGKLPEWRKTAYLMVKVYCEFYDKFKGVYLEY